MIRIEECENALLAYETYFALREYFRIGSKYDYFKFRGRILRKTVRDNFVNSKWATQSIKLYCKYKSKEEIEKAVVSNLLQDNLFIGDISYDIYIDFTKKYDSLLYTFEQDLKKIFSSYAFSTAEGYFESNANSPYSAIYELYLNSEITIETVIILDSITHFLSKIKKQQSDFIFDEEMEKLEKYKKFFIKWNKNTILQYKQVLKKIVIMNKVDKTTT